MKRFFQIFILLSCTLLAAFLSYAGISTSKHNLSVSGSGAIKATAETELCVFCHIPHNANPGVPLWNHTVASAAYIMYTSDYLTRAAYTTPSDVGQRSRLCLSCHDGTVAIGSVYMVRGSLLASPIAVSGTGVDITGKMTSLAAGYLGTDLTNDHPVSIKYDTGISILFGSGSRTIELATSAPPINPKPYQGVKLYGSVSGTIQGYVECTSCHDPHNDTNGKFLVVSNSNAALCTTCHAKTGWSGSIHQTSLVAINNPVGETQPIPGTTVANAACMGCHKSHSGVGIPYILRKAEENTCYNGTSISCHGSSGAKNINSVFGKAYVHPVGTASRHKNLDVLYPADLAAANRHAECYDCHNPHQAKNLPKRVAAASWYPVSVTSTSNLISNSGALTGVTGIEPASAPLWSAITTYTTYNIAVKEYQICYKCHSYYAIQNAVSPIASWPGVSSPYITDQAWEFSPGNKSAHPIQVGLNSQTGSYAPKALAAAQMSVPWSTNLGTQTMYCSDCHGADNETTTDSKGPHGSSYKYMLKGTNKYWPTNASGVLYKTGSGSTAADLTGLLCLNCHPLRVSAVPKATWYNNVHREHDGVQLNNVPCVACHVVVPHGSKRSRLIGYFSDPAPYNYNGAGTYDKLVLRGFKKAASRTGYAKSNCYSTVSGCTTHGTITGADP